jgi:hypothetical protein
MSWLLVATGGRKFRCIECTDPGPLKSSETLNFLSGALEPRSLLERLEGHAKKAREDLEKLPPGEKHDALVQRIREIQRAIDFNLH